MQDARRSWRRIGVALGWLVFAQACLLPEVWETQPNEPTTETVRHDKVADVMDASTASASPSVSDAGSSLRMREPSTLAGSGGMGPAGGTTGDLGPTKHGCSATNDVGIDGAFTPTHLENVGASRSAWVFYPLQIGQGGARHPVLSFSPPLGSTAAAYLMELNRLASHGIVVVSDTPGALLDGATENASLTFLAQENQNASSVLYQRLDLERSSILGHARGGQSVVHLAGDPRVKMFVLICTSEVSPSLVSQIDVPTLIVNTDESANAGGVGNFDSVMSPVVSLYIAGIVIDACVRTSLEPLLKFLRMQFCGDIQNRADFVSGEYCRAPWGCRSKMF